VRCLLSRPALLFVLVIGASGSAHSAEIIQTLGRRVTISGNLMALTEPDLNRVALYDISGARPRKIGAFGRVGFRPGELHGPHGATLDSRGRLYVADTFNHRIQVFDVAGLAEGRAPRLVSAFGNFGKGIGDLKAPHAAVAVSPHVRDRVFVTDSRNDRIQVFDRDGRPTGIVLGGTGAEEGKLSGPVGTAFDPRGRVLYVAEAGNRRVSAFDAVSGAFLFAFGRDLTSPGGIAVDGAGTVYVTDVGSRLVRRYAPVRGANGALRGARPAGAWGRGGTGPGEWTYPQAIAIDRRGRVYTVDQADDRGQIFSRAGAYLGSFGEDVEPAPEPDAPTPARLPKTLCSNGATYGIEILGAPDPIPLGDLFEIDLQVREGCRSGPPAETAGLEVEAIMPGHGHGMNTHPRVAPLGSGRFLATGLRFHMPGRWEIHFDVVRGGVLERVQAEVMLE
jgi:DNA-binding beta-propeller fold protein YncE